MATIESKKHETKQTLGRLERSVVNLRENDVVCEKGRGDHERWPGNNLYRYLVKVNKESYNDRTPVERSEVIGNIIASVREKDGWFVQVDEETGQWSDLCEEKVRKKVSDDLRREVRRRRERRSHNTVFSAKLRALKDLEEGEPSRDILAPVQDPRQTDVLFGAGARRHPGNKTYWKLMKLNLDQYIISPYGARSMISRSIVQGIRDQKGRFLEQDPKTAVWYEISDRRAIEKTSHALSNKKYKTRKRLPEPSSVPYGAKARLLDEMAQAEGARLVSLNDLSALSEGGSTEDQLKAKKRTKKFKLLNRMENPIVPGDVTSSSNLSIREEYEGIPDDESPPESPLIECSSPPTPEVKIATPDGSPPLVQHPKYADEHLDERAVISPNESRASPCEDAKDMYHEVDPRHFSAVYRRGLPIGAGEGELSHYAERHTEASPYDACSRGSRYERYPFEHHYHHHHHRHVEGPVYEDSPAPHLRGRPDDHATFHRYMDQEWVHVSQVEVDHRHPMWSQGPPRYGRVPSRRISDSHAAQLWALKKWGFPPQTHQDDVGSNV